MSPPRHFLWNYHQTINPTDADADLPPLPPPDDGVLRVIPLGGLGAIGLNIMVYEYGDDIIVVDCGQMMPDAELLGVDQVVPDVSYLVERADRVRGIVLTHGHEDHIGGLPYVLPQVPAPVYAAPFTLRLIREKLEEYNLTDSTDFREIEFREPEEIGEFGVTFIHVTHSIVDSAALAIETPIGTVVHSGDYKIDPNPADGVPFDFYSLSRLGEEGVLAYFGDSTNVEMPGHAPSESSIEPTLHRLFSEAPRAIVVATFSSSIHRVQTLVDVALEHGRQIFVTGFNLERNIRIAREIGCVSAPDHLIRDIREYPNADPRKAVILTTGSQGEPLSALSRMALDSHKQVKIKPDDMVILSSRMIPGNEKAIYRLINHLSRRGARVVYEKVANVHASGHCYSGAMAQMIDMLNPQFLVPIHGEWRHLTLHRDLAARQGIPEENIPILENGDVLEITPETIEIRGRLPVSRVLVDGKSVGEVGDVVLRDRHHLSQDGMVVILMTVDQSTDKMVAPPEIISRGFVHVDQNEELIETLRQIIVDTFEECDTETREDETVLKEEVRGAIRRYLRKNFDRFPMVLPVVLEI